MGVNPEQVSGGKVAIRRQVLRESTEAPRKRHQGRERTSAGTDAGQSLPSSHRSVGAGKADNVAVVEPQADGARDVASKDSSGTAVGADQV